MKSSTLKNLLPLILLTCIFSTRVFAQVPIAYWDCELNSSRNTTEETSTEALLSSLSAPSLTTSGLTAAHGTGNGTSYGGTNSGYALGYFGFTTSGTSSATSPHIQLGTFNLSQGIGYIYFSLDIMGIGSKRPTGVDFYYSTNGVSYTKVSSTVSVSTSYTSHSIYIPGIDNQTSVTLRIVPYGAGSSPNASDGVLRIDNITLSALSIRGNCNLISANVHGQGLSSGGSYFPVYNTFRLTGNTVNASSNLIIGDASVSTALTLFSGVLNMGSFNLTLQNSNTLVSGGGTSGRIAMNGGNLSFGRSGNAGGSSNNLPDNLFTTSPVVLSNLIMHRLNPLNLGVNSFTINGGTLQLNFGRLVQNGAGSTITIQNTNTPITRITGVLETRNNTNLAFGSAGNTSGNTFTIPDGTFFSTNNPINNITINRDNALNLGNQSFTINGTLSLANGEFNIGSNTLIFQNGNTPLSRSNGTLTTNSVSTLTFGTAGNTGGNAFTLPSNVFTNNPTNLARLEVNRTNSLTWNNQDVNIVGNDLRLTLGTLNLNNTEFTFYSSNTPIVRTSGQLSTTANTSLRFGITGFTTGISFTLPSNLFTSNPVVLNNFSVERINQLSLGDQSLVINGSLNLTQGVFNIGTNNLTFQNGNTPITRGTGTLTVSTSSDITFGTTGNTGGAAFAIPSGTFTATTPSIANLSVNRDNSLTLGNQNINLNNNLNLLGGELNDNGNTITVLGNITGTATHSGTGKILMTAGGNVSGATLGNLEINSVGAISLTGSPTITGTLNLINGNFNVGNNTLTFHTSNTPVTRTSGIINLATNSSLAFGASGNTGGSAFTIPDDLFGTNLEFANFTVNRTNSLTLNNQNFSINGTLTLTKGALILPDDYLFTLKSTSITNTAMVGVVGDEASLHYGANASFRVERYIPKIGGGRRAYRDLAPSVNSGARTIYELWQENGTNGLDNGVYYGTHITGHAGAYPGGIHSSGFDITFTGASSFATYDVSTITGNSSWKSWNSSNASINGTNDTLSAFKGYRITIRGNRLVNLYQNPQPTGMNDPATLRARGTLVYGDVVYNTSGVTANGATNTSIRLNSASATGYTIIGNPYACAVDWHALYDDASTANISPTYGFLDPNMGASGAYTTYNRTTGITTPGTSAANRYIQPGQAIFIQNTSTSPSITFKESHKAPNSANHTNVYRTNEKQYSRIHVDLYKNINNEMVVLDGVALAFDASFSNKKGNEDANKFTNFGENLAISDANEIFTIQGRRNLITGDSVSLTLWNLKEGETYTIHLNAENYTGNEGILYLFDKLNNSYTEIIAGIINTYQFIAVKTSFANRFVIVNSKDSREVIVSNQSTINIFPNPVTNKKLNFSVENLKEGTYNISVVTVEGKAIYNSRFFYNAAQPLQAINLPATTASGNYYLVLSNGTKTITKSFIVE